MVFIAGVRQPISKVLGLKRHDLGLVRDGDAGEELTEVRGERRGGARGGEEGIDLRGAGFGSLLHLASYIAGEAAKTNHGFCKWWQTVEIEANLVVNAKFGRES